MTLPVQPKKLNICIVSEFSIPYLYGGGEFRYYFIIQELLKRGHNVTWLCMRFRRSDNAVPGEEFFEGIRIIHRGPIVNHPPVRTFCNIICYFVSILWHLTKNKYDVIDVQAFLPLVPAFIVAYIFKRNMVATIHDVSSDSNNQWLQYKSVAPFFEKCIVKLPYRKILTGSDSIKKRLITRFGIPSRRISVIPYAINLEMIDAVAPNYDRSHHYQKNKLSICFVGRFAPNKRIADLLDAFQLVVRSQPNANLTIIGSGTEEEMLRNIVQIKHLDSCVNFLVGIDDKEKFKIMKQSQVLVLPSVREGFGLVLLEAMACQMAIVATNINGIRDVITQSHDGILVASGDTSALAAAILRVLNNSDLRLRLISNGRKTVEQKFQWAKNIEGIEKIYAP